MEILIKEKTTGQQQRTVEQKDTASAYGSGLLDVYATPAVVAFMENTALESIRNQIPEGYDTVGTHINIKHIKATPVGMKVQCSSILNQQQGNKLLFEVEAEDENGIIAQGTHTRYIVHKARFLEKISK